jgi:enoyl-[acyl-carrier protein] reductase I
MSCNEEPVGGGRTQGGLTQLMKLTRTTRAHEAVAGSDPAAATRAGGNGSAPAVEAGVHESVVSARAAVGTAAASARPARRSNRLVRPADDCVPEGLLSGKKALVFGVANDHSIAWGIAKALHDNGARVGFSSMPQLIKRRVRPLAASLGAHFVEGCDVRDDDEIRKVFERWADKEGDLDILVHAVAFAEKEDLAGNFSSTSRAGFHTAFDISVYSLIAMAREARPYMKPGSSIMTLTYYGAEKVMPHYNIMGVAKAALEASTRYLAADLGPSGIRVNAISAGPIRTLSAHGIAGFRTMHGAFADVAPLRRHITIEDVAGTAVYLASSLSGQTTGETIYVDGGFNILGLPVADE